VTPAKPEDAKIIPLFGKDEMNLIEIPFGPITSTTSKTFEVEHEVYDKRLKRKVMKHLIITGSDKWGLPRPVDEQVLMGMNTLSFEAGFRSPKVDFSRYHLCRTIGWEPDGRAYRRLEDSFDRIAGTTLKYKNGWFDKGEKEWKSTTFHLITRVELCSRDRLDRVRARTGEAEQTLCSFVWDEVIWKSFRDGFIKTVDMQLFRKICQGHRREVPIRLFRILDKRFYHSRVATFDLARLCIGTLGLSPNYSPSQMIRVLDRAAKWLKECDYLKEWRYRGVGSNIEVHFLKQQEKERRKPVPSRMGHSVEVTDAIEDTLRAWISSRSESELLRLESQALDAGFSTEFVRKLVLDDRTSGVPILRAGRIRQDFIRQFVESQSGEEKRASNVA
jgi:hypothetical protein